MLYLSFPAWSLNDKAHAIKQRHPTYALSRWLHSATLHILYEWQNQILGVHVCVCVHSCSIKTNKPYFRSRIKALTQESAEILPVSMSQIQQKSNRWVEIFRKSHSDSVSADARSPVQLIGSDPADVEGVSV